ncbi:AEC family transporter [Actinomyces sp. Z5]|uniref:AEC family transporter n=1 Tax=Actinomyces sp. Z5 TaxID=2250216 RepID=UPI000DCDB97A|nr:AEC family transporter [Actinomyces sp. Z5]RAX23925.1 AEC family transporter [Actinomyces sp. Z5]
MSDVIGGLAVFAVVIAVGWVLVRTGAVPVGSDTVLTRLCFFAATPALLITTLAGADLAAVTSLGTAVAIGAELLGLVTAWCVHRCLLHRPVAEAMIGALASAYVNAANLGIPVLVLVLGDATAVAPILLLQLLVLTPLAFTVLDAVTRRGSPSRFATYTLPLRNPLVLAVLVGVLVNLSGFDLDAALRGHLAELLDTLGRIAVPLMMLSLGMSLAASRLRPPQNVAGAPKSGRAGGAEGTGGAVPRVVNVPPEPVHDAASRTALRWAVAWKLLVVPGLAVGLGLVAGLHGSALLMPVTTASLPTAQNVFMYASRYGVAKPLARDAVLLTTAGFVPVVLLAAAVL